jgi:hypothetical protein
MFKTLGRMIDFGEISYTGTATVCFLTSLT